MGWFGFGSKKKVRTTAEELAAVWLMGAVQSAREFEESVFSDGSHPKTTLEVLIFHIAAFDYILRRGLVPPVYERVHKALVDRATPVLSGLWRVSEPRAYIERRIADYQQVVLYAEGSEDLIKLGRLASKNMLDHTDPALMARCSMDFVFILKNVGPALKEYEIVQ
ncbi:MAG: hypothetical protein M3P51_11675 [Chloroflexota bacterium]|nr:hypothetical protein [Chloroflexota bacterium]